MIEEDILKVNRKKKHAATVKRKKKKHRRNVIYDIITAVCVIVICVCSILIYDDITTRDEANTEIDAIQEYRPEIIYPDDSEVDYNMQASVAYSTLKAINSDYVGWLSIPGTKADLPVCHCSNNDYYLNHSFREEYSPYGCLFLDCDNDSLMRDPNSVVYGHTTYDGSMFGSLKSYKSQEYYESNPFIYLMMEEHTYCYQIFAVVVVPGTYDYRSPEYDSMEDFADSMIARSYISSSAGVSDSDRIITLSTCAASNSPDRLVVFGVLLNPDGSSVDTKSITP